MDQAEKRLKQRDKMRKYRAENPAYVAKGREQKARQTQRRKYWFGKIKNRFGCSVCGWNGNHVALDFDHINPSEKSFHIAQSLAGRSLRTIFAEIRKCTIVCANCHRIKSHKEAQKRRIYL